MSNRAATVRVCNASVIDASVTLQQDASDQQRQLEVSIDYTIALMNYWLTSADAVTACMTQILE